MGPRPVEDLRIGDQVLTQDTVTGALGYAPIQTIRPARREPVWSVTIDDEILVATDLERFWIAGKGWVQVHELGAGDTVRLLGGITRVTSVVDAGARTVYHIQVDEKRGLFVGRRGIMAHDVQVAQPVASPFDASKEQEPSRSGRAG
ncbi:polymorphic toxin-type HINT domain-containing protein [Singulisphaera sp. GP187]|uniref:polymorphic toxin-type HINT domain-containing protein n=1 Tax=Singulisphaera sp. GP187 TaxID=1882752 RepID=UPI0013565132|nr:polymorphic toxin-type HINT domain-containing protein [Singulisphaera sp. GP187]